MNFSEASYCLKHAKKPVRRKIWDKESFIYFQIPSTIKNEIIPNMTSLSEDVKEVFRIRGMAINFDNQFALVDQNNNITSYTPSTEDVYSDDWEIFVQKERMLVRGI